MVAEEIKKLVSESAGEDVALDADFSNLKIDSLDFVDLIQQVEQRFNIRISDEEVSGINTVGDLVSLVERHLTN